ncbi:MAG: hypothetical protein AAB074_18005 [Planctomycetota bacterium]
MWTIRTWPDRNELAVLSGSEFDHPRTSGGVFCLSCQAREGDRTSARGLLAHFLLERFGMSRIRGSPPESHKRTAGFLEPQRFDEQILTVESAGGRELRLLDELQYGDLRSFWIAVGPQSGFSMFRRRHRPSRVYWIGLTLMAVAWPGIPPALIPRASAP